MNNEVDLQVSWKRIVPVVRGLGWDLLAHTLDRLFLSPAAGTPSHRHQQPRLCQSLRDASGLNFQRATCRLRRSGTPIASRYRATCSGVASATAIFCESS